MKLTVFFLLIVCLNVSAHVSGQVSLSLKNVPLEKVFSEIEKQSPYYFTYTRELLKNTKPVSLEMQNSTLREVLDACLKEQMLTYSVLGNAVVIKTIRLQTPAQDVPPPVEVRGKITDTNGDPLEGSSVKILELNKLVVSKADGTYSIVLDPGTYTVEISHVSYQTRKTTLLVRASGNTTFNFRLEMERKDLEQVVVTALGIKRDEKSLGYAAQKVEGSELTKAPTANWINALSGKVPGLQLNKVGGPLGSSDVVLRGDNVLDLGGSTALIVIDGVPVSTQQSGTGFGPLVAGDNPVDFGSSLSDLNPEDIESLSVLKGPGAAALYGSRASNGAIIITTKSGKKEPGIGVYYNNSVSYSNVNKWPDYQYDYGAGAQGSTYYSYGNTADGTSTKNTTTGYGPRFNGQSFFQFNSPYNAAANPDPLTAPRTERVPWIPYKNFTSGFFRPGYNINNTIGLAGGGYRASLTYTKNTWIVPNTGFDRLTVALSGTQKISPVITVNSKVNYTRKSSDNLPGQGYNNQSIMYFMSQTANSFDINWFRQRWVEGKEGVQEFMPVSNGYLDNPYAIAYDMLNGSDRHNIIGNLNAQVRFNEHLNLMLRSGLDLSYEFRTQQRPIGTYKFKEGNYRQQHVYRMESNTDFLLKYDHTLPFGLQYTMSIGGNQRYNDYRYEDAQAPKLTLPNIYNLSNSKDPIQTVSDRTNFLVNSLYGFINLNYKEKLFLELTGRNDWSSKLPKQNSSFFYPSVNTSILIDKIAHLPSFVSLAKVRSSFAMTGVDSKDPYGFLVSYARTSFPGSLQLPATLPNPDLKPQFTNAFETGLDLRLFKNRLGLDLAIYESITRNQILNLPVDGGSGFTSALTNVGKVRNRGIEIQLRGTPLQLRNGLKWDINLNWAANRNKVMDVSTATGSGGQILLYNVSFANINMVAEEGKSLGQLYGIGFKRSPDGQIVNNANGIPVYGTELQNWGSINPDWTGGINNSFTYRNLSFSFLFDFRSGGKMLSYSHAILSATGKLRNSLPGREEGVVGEGVIQNADGSYSPNTVKAPAASYYNQYYLYGNMETNVFSTSFIKLRETSINYQFPKKLIRKSFIQDLSIGISGRDLFIWTDFPLFDPETATLNSSQVLPGIEIGQFPSTRSITFNLNIKF